MSDKYSAEYSAGVKAGIIALTNAIIESVEDEKPINYPTMVVNVLEEFRSMFLSPQESESLREIPKPPPIQEVLPRDVTSALKRIFSLSVIKDDESDDAYDGLYKIGRVAREVLMKYDADFQEAARKALEATIPATETKT